MPRIRALRTLVPELDDPPLTEALTAEIRCARLGELSHLAGIRAEGQLATWAAPVEWSPI